MMTPDEFTAQQPSSDVSPWRQFLAELRMYFVSNVITTGWSALLFAGGMIFLFYFFSIRFMPELSPQASITLLAASVLTAGYLFLLLIVGFFAPFLLWKISMPNYERLQILWYKDEQYALARVILWIGLPFAVIVASLFFLNSTTFEGFGISTKWALAYFAIIVLIPPLVLLLFWNKLPHNFPCILRWCVVGDLLRGSFWIFWGIFVSFYTLNVFLGILYLSVVERISIILPVLIWNLNLMVRMRQIPFWHNFAIPLVIFCFVLFQAKAWTFIPNLVMNIYKFGNIPNASLVFDEIGCSIVEHHHGVKVRLYTPEPTKATPNPKTTCSLLNVMIHSRLGNTYYLEASRNDGSPVRFTIPGQNVLSWAVNEPQKATTASSSTSTQSPAPTTETTPPNKSMEPTR